MGPALLLAAVLVTAGACTGEPGKDAQAAVQNLLAAAQAGDGPRFEAALDRPALRADLRRQMVEVSKANGIVVDGGPSDLALDRMIAPESVALAAADAGAVTDHLKKTGQKRVCLTGPSEDGPCLLTFAKARGNSGGGKPGWKLVGMQRPAPTVEIGVDLGS